MRLSPDEIIFWQAGEFIRLNATIVFSILATVYIAAATRTATSTPDHEADAGQRH
jgi:hypothetical protein